MNNRKRTIERFGWKLGDFLFVTSPENSESAEKLHTDLQKEHDTISKKEQTEYGHIHFEPAEPD